MIQEVQLGFHLIILLFETGIKQKANTLKNLLKMCNYRILALEKRSEMDPIFFSVILVQKFLISYMEHYVNIEWIVI